jgi:hypothetical protein
MFRLANFEPLSGCILEMPKSKVPSSSKVQVRVATPTTNQRSSPRLKQKPKKGKSILKMAQDLVTKKCGIVEQDLDNVTLQ